MTDLSEGDVFVVERTFTREDVAAFADVSGDDQPRHTDPDPDGRVLVQGLLTATMPTRIGSELGVLARAMTFEFHRPVHTGDTVACEVELTTVTERDDGHLDVVGDVTCHRERDDRTVLTGDFRGVID